MKAKELIGKRVTRIAPANCRYGEDGSYMGDVRIIVNADDNLIMIADEDGILNGVTHTLSREWCDNSWVSVEEFLSDADAILVNLQEEKRMALNVT